MRKLTLVGWSVCGSPDEHYDEQDVEINNLPIAGTRLRWNAALKSKGLTVDAGSWELQLVR